MAQRLHIQLRFTCHLAALHIQPLHTCPISTATRPISLPAARPISKRKLLVPSATARPTSTAARPIISSSHHQPIVPSAAATAPSGAARPISTADLPSSTQPLNASAQPLRRCMVPHQQASCVPHQHSPSSEQQLVKSAAASPISSRSSFQQPPVPCELRRLI